MGNTSIEAVRRAPASRFVGASGIALMWLALIPASDAGLIFFRVALHREPPGWLDAVDLAVLALLLILSVAVDDWHPLRRWFLALVAWGVGGVIVGHLEAIMTLGWEARMFADTLVRLIPCALLALTLLGTGLGRRDVFLTRGDMSAAARLPWGTVSWGRLGPVLILILAAGLSMQLMLTVHPDARLLGRALAALPLAMAFAAVNAAQEEFSYRVVFLSHLVPAVGASQALLVTSLLFGLAHWYGHPGGPSGVVLAGFAGYLWGKSMIETRGSAWAWLIHAFQDVVIFAFLVAARG